MTYAVLQRDYGTDNPNMQFSMYVIKGKDTTEVEDKIEESIANTNSQEWILTDKEFDALKKLIDGFNENILTVIRRPNAKAMPSVQTRCAKGQR